MTTRDTTDMLGGSPSCWRWRCLTAAPALTFQPKKYATYARVFEPFQPPEAESNAMAQYGTPEEAKAMLDKAVVALKEDKTMALDMFNKGDGDGFKDRDLYVYCANASDGIFTAHPKLKGKQLKDIKGEKGFPLGKEIMEKATEGKMQRGDLLVASARLGQGARKADLLHEGWRSNLRCWLLQVDLRLRPQTAPVCRAIKGPRSAIVPRLCWGASYIMASDE